MYISDRVYGSVKVTEPIFSALLETPSVVRLKKIAQYGVPAELNRFEGFSRYEHSVGVFLLLRKLGASLEEQIAGLLHDVSHTAFSHLVDWIAGDPTKESFQDDHHDEFFRSSELPALLQEFDIDPETVIDYKWFSLLEQEIPGLCADRVDYALRDFLRLTTVDEINEQINHLVVHKGQMVFDDLPSAERFARLFLDCQINHWGAPETRLRYHLFAQALTIALAERIIVFDDFWTDDDQVLAKVKQARNPKIEALFTQLRTPFTNDFLSSNVEIIRKKKLRYVDPKVMVGGTLYPLSNLQDEYRYAIELLKKAK